MSITIGDTEYRITTEELPGDRDGYPEKRYMAHAFPKILGDRNGGFEAEAESREDAVQKVIAIVMASKGLKDGG